MNWLCRLLGLDDGLPEQIIPEPGSAAEDRFDAARREAEAMMRAAGRKTNEATAAVSRNVLANALAGRKGARL